ncbi:hypothetical protein ACFGXH_03090 [Pasteurella multocida]
MVIVGVDVGGYILGASFCLLFAICYLLFAICSVKKVIWRGNAENAENAEIFRV